MPGGGDAAEAEDNLIILCWACSEQLQDCLNKHLFIELSYLIGKCGVFTICEVFPEYEI